MQEIKTLRLPVGTNTLLFITAFSTVNDISGCSPYIYTDYEKQV